MKDSLLKIENLLVDEALIDELVSGQLTGERYRAALRALDAEPAKWRDCALAFLEEQALRSDLQKLAKGTINWSQGYCPDESSNETAISVIASQENDFTSLQIEHVWSGRFRAALSTAALLLVSFTVGWLGAEVLAERERTESEAKLGSFAQNSTTTQPQSSSKADPEFFLDRPGSFDRGIPDPIRELERSGRIRVETYDTLLTTTLNDGSRAVVPVQQMIISPGTVRSY